MRTISVFYKYREALRATVLLLMVLLFYFSHTTTVASEYNKKEKYLFLVKVPSLVGLTGDEVAGKLNESNLRLGVVSSEESLIKRGSVIGQLPNEGSIAFIGSYVGVIISGGVKIPDVRGRTKMKAISRLTDMGLPGPNINAANSVQSCEIEGIVVGQSPLPDYAVDENSIINLVMSNGMPPPPLDCHTGCCQSACPGRPSFDKNTKEICEPD